MTAAADPRAAAVAVNDTDRPRLAEGTELLGEYEESGLEDAPSIARRADGQLVQLPQLLYLVAQSLDGRSSYEEIAQRVSQQFSKEVGAGDVRILVEEKLRPLGLLAGSEATPELQRDDPLLALKLKTAVVPAWIVRAATTLFYPLFFPPVMLAIVAAFVGLDVWLFGVHGVAQSFRHLLEQPALFLVVLGLVVLGTTFHEIGHATACRYGGAQPGAMGVGLYIIWPAFYTDVNDAYRLGRWGRIRTDLGGVYFNAIFALGMAGAYFATGFEPFLLVVIAQHFQMLQQSLPFLRLDGYYVIADLTGVPDLFARIGPILRGLVPGRPQDPKVAELKPWVRRTVMVWVLGTIPVLIFVYVLLILHIPRLISTGSVSFWRHADTLSSAAADGRWAEGTTALLHIALLVVPTLGASYVLARTAKRLVVGGWRATAGRAPLRVGFLGAALVAATVLTVGLWPDEDYTPIQPDERGTLFEATTTLARTTTEDSPVRGTPAPVEATATPSPTPLFGDETDPTVTTDPGSLRGTDGSSPAPTPTPTPFPQP